MALRKYYIIKINKNNKANVQEIDGPIRSDKTFWINQRKLNKKDFPGSKTYIYFSKNGYVDYILTIFKDGTKNYIVSHRKYQEMIKNKKFIFN